MEAEKEDENDVERKRNICEEDLDVRRLWAESAERYLDLAARHWHAASGIVSSDEK